MGRKFVLVHNCKHADMDDGLPFDCDCRKYVDAVDAQVNIAGGLAVYKKFQKHTGGYVDNKREIVSCGRQPEVPRAATVEEEHIQRAYVYEKQFDAARIEYYGELAQETLAGLGAGLRDRGRLTPPTVIIAQQPGDGPAIPIWNDFRTDASAAAIPPDAVLPETAACVRCGQLVTDPKSYPRLFGKMTMARCPFCGEPDGLSLGRPGRVPTMASV